MRGTIRRYARYWTFILVVGVLITYQLRKPGSLYRLWGGRNEEVKHVNPAPSSHYRWVSEGNPILLWWDSVYTDVDTVKQCGSVKCRVTNNRSLQYHPDTKVFLFYGSHFRPYNLPFPRTNESIWSLIHEESPRNAYILSRGYIPSVFNFTATYNRKSDYPITTQWLKCPDWLQDADFLVSLEDKNRYRKDGMAPILYIQSDCDVPSDRDSFVRLLMKHIQVDSYGPCLRNKHLPNRLRFRDSMAAMESEEFYQLAAKYKFTLAMENYVCDDYITEKVWRPLRLGSVPIIFGAPNIRSYLPDNESAILIEDFTDAKALAEYIHYIDRHDQLYRRYLFFKNRALQNCRLQTVLETRDWQSSNCKRAQLEKQKHSSIFYGFECFLCNEAHVQMTTDISSKPKVHIADTSQFRCPSPKRFDSKGRYRLVNESWSLEWRYGLYEAEAMSLLYGQSRTVSKVEFRRMVKTLADDNALNIKDAS